jgi:5-methylcytosine-specific restriction protein B
MLNKGQLDQLISALTTADIITSMDECDRDGVDAFLGRYGFGKPQVWTERPIDGEKNEDADEWLYPAKAIVAFAVGNLPNGQTLTPKEFFNGAGEAQSFKCLTDLGFELIDKRKLRDQAALFTREAIEAAMIAYDDYEQNGTRDEIFGAFGTPSDYWVRSTRSNPEQPYPTKPLVGFILEKTTLNGGWGQKTDAAARLHNAGYIIVDKNDDPVGPPERYSHLIKDADRIRLCAKNYYIEPAREVGKSAVSIRAGDLGKGMGLQDAHPNICSALLG